MGIGPFRREEEYYYGESVSPPPITVPSQGVSPPGNPDPLNYEILRSQQVGRHLVVEVKYLDCTNYEGRKIMVYSNLTISNLILQKVVDPHFTVSDKFRSPIARFEPTDRGWKLALAVAKMDL